MWFSGGETAGLVQIVGRYVLLGLTWLNVFTSWQTIAELEQQVRELREEVSLSREYAKIEQVKERLCWQSAIPLIFLSHLH